MIEEKFSLTVNDKLEFDWHPCDAEELDVAETGKNTFHILRNNKTYRAEVLEADFSAKTFRIKINGSPYKVKIADDYDLLVKKWGLAGASGKKIKNVKAPMPGLVVGVSVEVGQEVSKGDPLLILEAMKMENVLKSLGEGRVKAVFVEQGTAVDKDQLLIEME